MVRPIADPSPWRYAPDLNWIIAEHVMGWWDVWYRGGEICDYYDHPGRPGILMGIPEGESELRPVPNWASDCRDARKLADEFQIEIGPGFCFDPLAVCITALRIVHYDVDELRREDPYKFLDATEQRKEATEYTKIIAARDAGHETVEAYERAIDAIVAERKRAREKGVEWIAGKSIDDY